MNRKILLLPMLSLFLVGCNGQNSPFDGDTYVAKGMTPSHKIVRNPTNEEKALYEDSRIVSDAYLSSVTQTYEQRLLPKKALPNHITATTCDERSSVTMISKRYDNNVRVLNLDIIEQSLYSGSVINSQSSTDYYLVVNDEETQITSTYDVTGNSGVRTVSADTASYDPATDYATNFNVSFEVGIWNKISSSGLRATADDLIAFIDIETTTTAVVDAYVAEDGSRFIIETNSLFEVYLAKGVDSDSDEEYYYLSYARQYSENLIISEEIPNIVSEPIAYLKKPVLLSYAEEIIVASVASNGNFVTSQIPEVTA